MKIRAAVLEEFGKPLVVQEVELAEPKAGEVLVRLVACGVCHTDLYTASGVDPSGYAPDGARARGSGRGRVGGAGREPRRTRRSRRHPVLAPVRRVRPLPRRPHEPLPRDPRAAEQGLPARRHGEAVPRRRGDPPLHGHLDLRRVHGDAGDRARQGQPGGAARPRLPLRLRPLDRARRRDQHGQGRGRARPASSSAPAWSGSAPSPAAACREPSGSSASTSPRTASSSPGGRAPPRRWWRARTPSSGSSR